MLAGWDGEARAVLVMADQLKPQPAAAVARVRGLGLRPVLLTGDNGRAASAVAGQLGIPAADVFAGVGPKARSRPSGGCRRTGSRSPWSATG